MGNRRDRSEIGSTRPHQSAAELCVANFAHGLLDVDAQLLVTEKVPAAKTAAASG
jgi:hypothetical protein